MGYQDRAYAHSLGAVADAGVDARAQFIARTYTHLFGAMLAFTGIEIALFKTEAAYSVLAAMSSAPFLLILGAFVIVGWLARHFARQSQSLPLQYAALGAYVVLESIIFVPLLAYADIRAPGAIQSAAFLTLLGFGGLTAVAFVTRKDFSFLGAALWWGGIVAIVAIIGAVVFGFTLGTWFSVAMVALAGGSILYDTSKVLHYYSEDRYVSASLELFASVAMLFYYLLRLTSSRR